MKRLLLAGLIALAACVCVARPAHATTCTIPYSFTAGTPAVATQVNANFNSLQTCGNNIDHANIGIAGVYASQIIPDNAGHATFGGTIAYTFANGLTVNNGLTLSPALGIGNGGTNSTSYTNSTCVRYNGTALVSASADCFLGLNSSGLATASKEITVQTTYTSSSCSANNLCVPSSPTSGVYTFPGSFSFTSANTFSCYASHDSPNPPNFYLLEPASATTFVLQFDGAQNAVGSGNTFTITYTCVGY